MLTAHGLFRKEASAMVETWRDVGEAVHSLDRAALEKYGRFLQPMGNRLLAGPLAPLDRALIQERLQTASSSYRARGSSCQKMRVRP